MRNVERQPRAVGDQGRRDELGPRLRLGLVVFVVLMVVEAIEYIVGTSMESWSFPILLALAVPGAGLIVYYFMHIKQIARPGE